MAALDLAMAAAIRTAIVVVRAFAKKVMVITIIRVAAIVIVAILTLIVATAVVIIIDILDLMAIVIAKMFSSGRFCLFRFRQLRSIY